MKKSLYLLLFLSLFCGEIYAVKVTFYVVNKGEERIVTVDTSKKEVEYYSPVDGYHRIVSYTYKPANISNTAIILNIEPNIIRFGDSNSVDDITTISFTRSVLSDWGDWGGNIMMWDNKHSSVYYNFDAKDKHTFDTSFKKLVQAFGITSDTSQSKGKKTCWQ